MPIRKENNYPFDLGMKLEDSGFRRKHGEEESRTKGSTAHITRNQVTRGQGVEVALNVDHTRDATAFCLCDGAYSAPKSEVGSYTAKSFPLDHFADGGPP
jgi:hypothetical protein